MCAGKKKDDLSIQRYITNLQFKFFGSLIANKKNDF